MIIEIKITPPPSEISRTWAEFPRRLNAHIAAALDVQNELTIASAVTNRLRFPSSAPPVPDGLRLITGHLARSLSSRKAVDTGDGVTSAIQSSVKYAAVHEYGFEGRVFVRPHSRKTQKHYSKTLGRTKIQRGEASVRGFSRNMHLPARSFIRSTLRERQGDYEQAIKNTVADTLKEMPRA